MVVYEHEARVALSAPTQRIAINDRFLGLGQ